MVTMDKVHVWLALSKKVGKKQSAKRMRVLIEVSKITRGKLG
jgi:hypothetical protein